MSRVTDEAKLFLTFAALGGFLLALERDESLVECRAYGDFRAFRDLGVSAVDLSFVGKTVDGTLADMKRFRDEVASRL